MSLACWDWDPTGLDVSGWQKLVTYTAFGHFCEGLLCCITMRGCSLKQSYDEGPEKITRRKAMA